MEAATWSDLLNAFYTKFVLRDFAGKIIPAAILMLAVSLAFYEPRTLYRRIQRVRWEAIALVAGACWIVGLAMQNLGESAYLWRYFPPIEGVEEEGLRLFSADNETFREGTRRLEGFFHRASDTQRLQYERFVVIKEATGNLWLALLLSGIFWGVLFAVKRRLHQDVWTDLRPQGYLAAALVGTIAIFSFKMHIQHAERQFNYATHQGPAARTVDLQRPANGSCRCSCNAD